MQITILLMSSIKAMDLVQTNPSTVLYETLSHKLLSVQRVKALASETSVLYPS